MTEAQAATPAAAPELQTGEPSAFQQALKENFRPRDTEQADPYHRAGFSGSVHVFSYATVAWSILLARRGTLTLPQRGRPASCPTREP